MSSHEQYCTCIKAVPGPRSAAQQQQLTTKLSKQSIRFFRLTVLLIDWSCTVRASTDTQAKNKNESDADISWKLFCDCT